MNQIVPSTLKDIRSIHQSIFAVCLFIFAFSNDLITYINDIHQTMQSLFGVLNQTQQIAITMTDVSFTLEAVISILVSHLKLQTNVLIGCIFKLIFHPRHPIALLPAT